MDESDIHVERLPTEAFGYVFTHIPEHVRDDLESLEREGAIYGDQWIEELSNFRHVRIGFTEEECKEFVRRSWAFELWIRAGMPQWARDTPGIDQDIASEADSYVIHTRDGESLLGRLMARCLVGTFPQAPRLEPYVRLSPHTAQHFQISLGLSSVTFGAE
jgi:hypothetical protein